MSKVDFVAESGKQTTVITQIFDAPRDFVWKIYKIQNYYLNGGGLKCLKLI